MLWSQPIDCEKKAYHEYKLWKNAIHLLSKKKINIGHCPTKNLRTTFPFSLHKAKGISSTTINKFGIRIHPVCSVAVTDNLQLKNLRYQCQRTSDTLPLLNIHDNEPSSNAILYYLCHWMSAPEAEFTSPILMKQTTLIVNYLTYSYNCI